MSNFKQYMKCPGISGWVFSCFTLTLPDSGERENLQINKVQQVAQVTDRSLYVIITFFPVEGPGRLRHQQKGAKKNDVLRKQLYISG